MTMDRISRWPFQAHLVRLAFGVALLSAAFAARAEITYAHVEFVKGTVSIVDAKGQARMPQVNDKIFAGETILTGRDGELHARTDDHGYVAFRANTRMKIDSYLAEGDKDDNVVMSLLYGSLRSITGWIGKHNADKYAIRTPTATIGIRGTDHEPHVILPPGPGEGPPAAPPGTYEKVHSGATVIKNEGGQTVVNANHVAFAPHDGKAPPRALDRAPDIYKPTANEGRIENRGKELVKEMEEKRQARIKEAAEKREEAHKKAEKRRRKPADK